MERFYGSPERENSEGDNEQEFSPELIEQAEKNWAEMSQEEKDKKIMTAGNVGMNGIVVRMISKFSIKQLVEGEKMKPEALRALVNLVAKG